MYRLIQVDGTELGTVETVQYIQLSNNGFYVRTTKDTAVGVAYESKAYPLAGHTDIEGTGVLVVEVDGGRALYDAVLPSNITFVALAETGSIDAVTATEHASLFGAWQENVTYAPGQLRTDPLDGCLYRVNEGMGHTSLTGWNPSLTPAMWTLAGDPNDPWPAWAQPTGAQDCYGLGSQTSHVDKHWVSEYANNVWEPGVFGWAEAEDV